LNEYFVEFTRLFIRHWQTPFDLATVFTSSSEWTTQQILTRRWHFLKWISLSVL
jgi:hypothetical protein